jgi:hypothetical protein
MAIIDAIGWQSHTLFSSKPEALHDRAMRLKQRYPDQQIAVACELKKGPLIYALSKYNHLTLFTINPSAVANYRKAFTPNNAKDDPSDAFIQVEILTLHMGKLTVIEPESAAIRSLAQLVEYRRSLVQDSVDLSNKITAALKITTHKHLNGLKKRIRTFFATPSVNGRHSLTPKEQKKTNTLRLF